MNQKPDIQPITRRMLLEQRIYRIEHHIESLDRHNDKVAQNAEIRQKRENTRMEYVAKLAALKQELAAL